MLECKRESKDTSLSVTYHGKMSLLHNVVSFLLFLQTNIYGANVIIFEGIMAFAYKDLRDVSHKAHLSYLLWKHHFGFGLEYHTCVLECLTLFSWWIWRFLLMLILMFAWQDGKLRLFQLFVKKKKLSPFRSVIIVITKIIVINRWPWRGSLIC